MFSFHLICLFDFDFYPYHMSYELRRGCYSTLKDPALCQWSTLSCQCCFRCHMNSAGYVRNQGNNETCAKNAFAMYQSAPDLNGNSIFFLPELKKNWTDRQSNCKVTSRLNLTHGVWNPLGANVLCWPVNKFNEILPCVQSNTLTAWQSFELVSFHANLTGVQMDQNPYF